MQRGSDDECKLFQQIAEQGHYAGRTVPSDTRQGIYATTANGKLLASINTNDPRRMEEMLTKALARWNELSHDERTSATAATKPVSRWEDKYPTGGLVLHVFTRDVERPLRFDDWRAKAWNQDFAWFTKDEARALAPARLEVGESAAWPSKSSERLARCHLVDDVRGQVPAFSKDAIEKAEFTSTVTAVGDGRATLAIRGATRTEQRGRWAIHDFKDGQDPAEQTRGFEAELVGRAVLDVASSRFVEFELVAVGSRWGATQFNGRSDDPGPAPMGVFFALAGDRPEEHVAPASIWEYGW